MSIFVRLVDAGSRSGVVTITMRPDPKDRFAPEPGDVLVARAYWGADADIVAPSGWTEFGRLDAAPHPRGMAKSAAWWYRVTVPDFLWPTLNLTTATWVEYEFCRYAGVPSW